MLVEIFFRSVFVLVLIFVIDGACTSLSEKLVAHHVDARGSDGSSGAQLALQGMKKSASIVF